MILTRRSFLRGAAGVVTAAAAVAWPVPPSPAWGASSAVHRRRRGRARTYYVSNASIASDGNPGTSLEAPFRTLTRAAAVCEPGDTIYVRCEGHGVL